ncbi:sugar phosphate isomerase/epimerase [Saprospiraceae bacterium]|nr:sugar phosphate isomerase/epimerase [Saprospiraceae bacterium]
MSSRRKFIRNGAVLSMAPFVMNGLYGCKSENSSVKMALENGFTLENFGIQLWTVRDAMAEDVKGTFKSLSEYGYNQIESFQGDQGVFWGMKPAEYKSYLGDLGLNCISSHCDSNYAIDVKKEDEFKKLVDDAASIGIQYLICPYLGGTKTIDGFKEATDGFNRLGKIAKASGITYGYHNHSYSFKEMEGQLPQDVMMKNSDKNLVEFEMDIYWVVAAGHDPVEWLKKYPNRFTMSHIKDRYKPAKIKELEKTEEVSEMFGVSASCVLGTGQIDFDAVLSEARKQGMKQWIVEQERYDDMSSMEAAQKDASFMKKYQV